MTTSRQQLRALVGQRQGSERGRRLGSSVVADSELLSGTWATALGRRGGGGESIVVCLSCRIRQRPGLGLEVRLVQGEQVQQTPLSRRPGLGLEVRLGGEKHDATGGEGGGVVQP
eukprot:CAMPEP_0180186880 /NCGR_PEP_ID=MMETSP0986-20121125/43226_1 /TAXON_ID=697907 /ORGANISM="non described non described, Strain CCMP2293" /LENGTH=114 /DNA_ID=CAMNT_0022140927 /DNA_START=138 /DNA_END=483 /DNA_ORIENTATION=+